MIFFDLACILRANCCNRIFMTVVFLPYSMNSLIFVLSITPRIMKYPIGIQSFEQLIEDGICLCRQNGTYIQLGNNREDIFPLPTETVREKSVGIDIEKLFSRAERTVPESRHWET